MEGAAANSLKEQPVADEVKAERRARFMELSAQISKQRLQHKVGRTLPVLIDAIEADEDGGNIIGVARSAADAPEIDGTVNIALAKRDLKTVSVGSLVNVKITAAGDYDLDAQLINPS